MVIKQGLKLLPVFSQGSCLGPFSSLCIFTILRVALNSPKADMHAGDTHARIASSDIAELIRMTNQELLNISD